MNVGRITKAAMLACVAVIAGIIESMLPPLLSFAPGVKLGLANVVVLFAIVTQGGASASFVLAVKLVLVAAFSGNPAGLMYSLPAGIASFAVSLALIRLALPKISVITVSSISAITHNAVQVGIASVIAGVNLAAIIPLTLAASLIAGYGVGVAVYFTIKKLPDKFL